MKKAIVTGAGGFIGGALTKKLLDNGWLVYGIDLKKIKQENERFISVSGNLNDTTLFQNIPDDIDTVFHLAWGGSLKGKDLYDADLQIANIQTTSRFFENVAHKCRRFVFCGSSYEYMKDLAGRKMPVCAYGVAKRAAADICASAAYGKNIGFVKAVLTNTFGVGDYSDKAVNVIIRKMIKGETLSLVEGKQRNDWVYIDDTVSGLNAAAEKGTDFEEYYIGHREISTFKEKIRMMRDLLCPKMELAFGTMAESTYVDYSEIDLDALHDDTGFECRADFKESILKTAAWLKESNR